MKMPRGSSRYDQAFKCYQKAANMGVSESYLILGSMYYDGTGVGKDYEYYNKACKMGEELGCKNVKTLLGD